MKIDFFEIIFKNTLIITNLVVDLHPQIIDVEISI